MSLTRYFPEKKCSSKKKIPCSSKKLSAVFKTRLVGLHGRVRGKPMVERLVRHPEAVRTDPDDVPGRISDVGDDLDSEESVDGVLGVEAFEDSVAVPRVEVEGSEDLPSSEVVDDLHQRLLAVALHEAELHASLQKRFSFKFLQKHFQIK